MSHNQSVAKMNSMTILIMNGNLATATNREQ